MACLAGRDVVAIGELSRPEIEHVLETARRCEEAAPTRRYMTLLSGAVLATVFLEPSTRTRLSFESAMQRLGGGVVSVADPASSSLAKGESLTDMVRIVEQYADVLVLRSPCAGAACEAACVAHIPVINAGDGTHEHPTQALLDLYTIQKECGRLDGLTVACIGDLKHGRTVHSLLVALQQYRPTVIAVAPPELALPASLSAELRQRGITVDTTATLDDALRTADVVYVTRIQRERFDDVAAYDAVKDAYRLDRATVERTRSTAILLHPLPRLHELATDLDDWPKSAYFRQAGNGLWVREALLGLVLGAF